MKKLNSIQTIVLIGAGNVASHLAEAFKNTGRKIIQVYSRSESAVRILAEKSGAAYTCDLSKLIPDADLYIISVADAAYKDIDSALRAGDRLVVHTSGFHSMDAISNISTDIGVFYPLQTFSKDHPVHYLNIPVCIEANNSHNLSLLEDLARSFTTDVRCINSVQRKHIHLAAVFACNFTNHFYGIAGEILKGCDVSFDILKPLIKETAAKVMHMTPHDAQTGPARRKDDVVMQQHLSLLDDSEMKALYEKISKMIAEKYK